MALDELLDIARDYAAEPQPHPKPAQEPPAVPAPGAGTPGTPAASGTRPTGHTQETQDFCDILGSGSAGTPGTPHHAARCSTPKVEKTAEIRGFPGAGTPGTPGTRNSEEVGRSGGSVRPAGRKPTEDEVERLAEAIAAKPGHRMTDREEAMKYFRSQARRRLERGDLGPV